VPSSYVKRLEKLEKEVAELRKETVQLRQEAKRLKESLKKTEEYSEQIRNALNKERRKEGKYPLPKAK